MRTIRKGREPRSLTRYRKTAGATYRGYPDKQDLREALVREQGGVCCYCMNRIRPSELEMKIEHWHSQRRYKGEQLAYKNLFGACLGGKGNPPDKQHCDTRKGKRDLDVYPGDKTHPVERIVRYLSDGTIEAPGNATFNRQLESVLNLNLSALTDNRKATLDAFVKAIPAGHVTRNWVLDQFQNWSTPGPKGLTPYYGVVLYWLEKKLARM